ncbi:MAG: beta-propeller fold lactonase family protein [Dermatophilus congolensis]|nr:beta-propeller fold lactonase family protein [Dermatophilus congolensis]
MSDLVLVANSEDGTISTLRLRTDGEPRLESVATAPVGPGVGTFAIDTARDLVYAAHKGDPAIIVTLRLDRATGYLTPIARREVDSSMTYLALAHDGSLLLGASYGGGFGAVWPAKNGVLGDETARVEFANLHCVKPVADGGNRSNTVYFVSLGQDLIAQYRLDEFGELTPLSPETVAAPQGSGARHLVVEGDDAYLVTEFSGEAIRFEVGADGTLTQAESVAFVDPAAGLSHGRFGADPVKERHIWGADLHVAGRTLLCSERNSSTITSISLTDDGHLGDVVSRTETEKQPRGFTVSPDGRYAIGVGEKSKRASLYRVEADGSLALLHRHNVGDGANWVRFVE